MPLQPKPQINNLPAAFHGGINFAAATMDSIKSQDILDFSVCCNPYRPPRKIYSALCRTDIQSYPDPDSSELIRALSMKLGIPTSNLIAGSGSTELIRLAATAYFNKGDTVIFPSPTYGEYELACRIVNARTVKYPLNEADNFQLDRRSFISFAMRYKPSGIFLCNPNNPTGQYLKPGDVREIAKAFPDSLIILDEAYIAFAEQDMGLPHSVETDNLLIIRSMTKDYSMAGLRLGYAIASREIIDTLKKVRPPWNVNAAAQQAGIAALSCDNYLSKCKERIRSSTIYLAHQMQGLGFKVITTDANFFIFKVGDAAHFQDQMLRKGFLVRDCTSFGLPDYVRVAPRSRIECIKFIKAVKELRGAA